MQQKNLDDIFSPEFLDELLPPQRSDEFFEALYGDPDEGVYDIRLEFKEFDRANNVLALELQLLQRPGKCLACNLTHGLPEVFSRHPLINISDMVKKIESRLDSTAHCVNWELGRTRAPRDDLHIIPLTIRLG